MLVLGRIASIGHLLWQNKISSSGHSEGDKTRLHLAIGIRANLFQGGWAIFAQKFFSTALEKTAMLTCKITLPNSPHPVIISKNPGFRALYLATHNEFRLLVL